MDRYFNPFGAMLLSSTLCIFLAGTDAKSEVRVQVAEDSTLRWVGPSGEKRNSQKLDAGVPTAVNLDAPAEILSPSSLPVILIPIKSEGEIRVNPPKVREVIEKVKQEETNNLLSEVMGSLHDIQNLIQKRKLDQATMELDQLEQKYPGIHFLKFTRASILLLKGNRTEALQTAKSALSHTPNYEEGTRFVKELEGGSQK